MLGTGCQRASESVPSGAYAYTSYDSSGIELVSGWLTIIAKDSVTIAGEWHLDAMGNPEGIGPQTGNGKLVGGIDGEKAWIELNPSVRNDNLQLNGILAHGRFDGQWAWINYNGVSNLGTFHAVRK